jgi:hypothetical protein
LPEGVLQSDWAQVKCTYSHLAFDWLLQTGKAFNVNNISATKERNSQNTARQRNSNEFLCDFYTMSSSNDTTVHLRVSVEASQGSRKSMEDYTSVTIESREDRECFFAVFDGHGGHQAAFFAKQNLWKTIQKQKDFYSGDPEEVGKAIKRAFVEVHTAMWKERGKHLKIYKK